MQGMIHGVREVLVGGQFTVKVHGGPHSKVLWHAFTAHSPSSTW